MERSRETIEKPNISEKEVKIETDNSLEPKVFSYYFYLLVPILMLEAAPNFYFYNLYPT